MLVCPLYVAVTNGHSATKPAVIVTTKKLDEQKLAAEKAASVEFIRRQMEEERERRMALIAEVCFTSRFHIFI